MIAFSWLVNSDNEFKHKRFSQNIASKKNPLTTIILCLCFMNEYNKTKWTSWLLMPSLQKCCNAIRNSCYVLIKNIQKMYLYKWKIWYLLCKYFRMKLNIIITLNVRRWRVGFSSVSVHVKRECLSVNIRFLELCSATVFTHFL